MKETEEKKFNVITKVENKVITRKEASLELNLSLRQIDRLRIIFRKDGKNGFIHKNAGMRAINKIDDNIIQKMEDSYLEDYSLYNFLAFYEEEQSNYPISYQTMVNKFLRDGITSPLSHKKTLENYYKDLKETLDNPESKKQEKISDLYKSRIIESEKAHTRRSSNLYGFGQEVQMDACEKIWFGDKVSYLHLAVDKGTKKILFGWFEWEEITRGYFVLLYNIIINYGIPLRIKTDNRNSFSNNENKTDTTQFGIICKELNIELVTTSIPTSKANVERMNNTVKNRLIAELDHEGIVDIDKANEYLNKIFIPKMNKKFSYAINSKTSKMRKNNYTEEELALIISEKEKRIIDNASSIKYDYDYYVPTDLLTGEIVCFTKGTECQFIITYNGDYRCKIEGKYYDLKKIENRDSVMIKESEIKKPKKEHHKYIPPKNHPWRKNMMSKKI